MTMHWQTSNEGDMKTEHGEGEVRSVIALISDLIIKSVKSKVIDV